MSGFILPCSHPPTYAPYHCHKVCGLKTNYGFHVTFQGLTRKVQSGKFIYWGAYLLLYRQVLFSPGSSMQSQDSEETINPSQPREASGGGPAAHHCPSFLGLFEPPWGILSCSSVPVPALQEPLSLALCRAQLAVPPPPRCAAHREPAPAPGSGAAVLDPGEPQFCVLCSACPRAQPELALIGSCLVPACSRSFPDTP